MPATPEAQTDARKPTEDRRASTDSPAGTLRGGEGEQAVEKAARQAQPSDSPPPLKDEADAFLVEFDRDDPLHPYNLPLWRKWVMVIIVSSSSLCVTCASSMGASTYAGIEAEFGISQEVAILTVSLFVLGLSMGPLLLGPSSELWGRNRVYYASLGGFFLLNFPVAFANNVAVHFIFRFLTAFAGSAFLSVAGGSVSDMFDASSIGAPMALFSQSPFLGPVLGPVCAGFINQNTSWRWTYYLVLAWSFGQLVALVVFAPETHVPTLLKRKASARRRETGDDRWMALAERNPIQMLPALRKSVVTPFALMRDEPMVVALNLWTAVLLAILYLDFNAIPIVFRQVHGFNQQCAGLAFLGLGVGIVGSSAFLPLWKRLYIRDCHAHGGKAPPEARLRSGMLGAILVPLSLYLFAATSIARVHWIVPIIMTIPFGMGIVFVFSAVFGYLVDTYRGIAASALSSNTFVRCLMSAGFPLFSNQMYGRLGTVGAGCVLGGITTILAPLPFLLFYSLGPKLRAKSRWT